jgi:hypothetical protein
MLQAVPKKEGQKNKNYRRYQSSEEDTPSLGQHMR